MLRPQTLHGFDDGGGHGDGVGASWMAAKSAASSTPRTVGRGGGLEQFFAVFGADVIDKAAHKEAVVERGELVLVVGQLVRGGDKALQGHVFGLAAVVVFAFVENGQQGIENRQAGFENFVEKGKANHRQIAHVLRRKRLAFSSVIDKGPKISSGVENLVSRYSK